MERLDAGSALPEVHLRGASLTKMNMQVDGKS